MRVLYLGDVVGRAGREAVYEKLPGYRAELDLDLVVVNGENAAGGFGITPKICDELRQAGTDLILTGNHVWDQREIIPAIDGRDDILRPLNYPDSTPGRGAALMEVSRGRRALVLQVMGRIFMDPLDDPFAAVQKTLSNHRMGRDLSLILVDIHGEATSEKMAMGHYLDGRVSAVIGSHTHIPSADAQILPNGTAYQTDIGMCGDYNSVIGMEPSEPIQRFTRKISSGRFTPAVGQATVCGVLIVTDDASGKAVRIAPLRDGPRLEPAWPGSSD